MRELLTEDPDLYVVAIQDNAIKLYLEASLGLILFWDWVTHLDDEVDLIWMWDWCSLGKPTYLALRYGGLAAHIYDLSTRLGVWETKYCKLYRALMPMATALSLYLVDIVLAYRAACLYPNQFRLLSIINTILLSCSALSSAILLAIAIPSTGPAYSPMYLTGCWATRMSFNMVMIGPPLLFELWMFSLVVFKIYLTYVENNLMRTKTMFRLVVRDQIYWFFLITGLIIWGAVQFAFARPTLRNLPFIYTRSFSSTCGCHLILHVRQSYNQGPEDSDVNLSTVLFRKPVSTSQSCTLGSNDVSIVLHDPELESFEHEKPDLDERLSMVLSA